MRRRGWRGESERERRVKKQFGWARVAKSHNKLNLQFLPNDCQLASRSSICTFLFNLIYYRTSISFTHIFLSESIVFLSLLPDSPPVNTLQQSEQSELYLTLDFLFSHQKLGMRAEWSRTKGYKVPKRETDRRRQLKGREKTEKKKKN